MVTEKIYENDSYVKEFDATVISCEAFDETYYQVVLERTVFFPEGGGQNPDTGSLNGHPVVDVQIKNGLVYHKTTLNAAPGGIVHGEINWQRRFDYMQQHSGEHIFSGVVNRCFGYNNVGFHLGDQIVTMDFDGVLNDEDIYQVEHKVNEIIAENVPISVSYPDEMTLRNMHYRSKIDIEGQVRIVTVAGYDVCACCAPHVSATGAVGGLKVVGFQKYKGGTRVSIMCGLRALGDYRMKQSQLEDISRQLSVPVEAAAEGVRRQGEETGRLKQRIYELTWQMIERDVQSIADDAKNVLLFRDQMEPSAMRKIINLTVEKVSGLCGVFCGNDTDGYKYIIGTKSDDARVLAKNLQEKLGARGGGSNRMVQGSVNAPAEKILAVLPADQVL